ncbi:pilus assembly protein TadG-related protein [Sphingomonas sp. Y38-1Y]|uniref:pilus assembly protein TadG-related protein n=1 Tax=Sphingomonas sp. Y38-1Y TaxID=3078265 RepID=UPI0028E9D983|nr:pilus assembly protein TadG-related protein [Sphingomonas sp. Y38-1Y]
MIRRLAKQRRGATAVIVAGAMPMLVGLAAVGIDLGAVQLERRRLQGVADAGALAAVRDPSQASAIANAMVTASPGRYPVATETVTGRYAADAAPDARFVAGGADPDAVRVTVRGDVPTLFAAVFGTRAVTVERRATARRLDLASFAVGSRLASLDGGVANALLSGLTGGNVSLSLMDYNALARAKVDLIPWLKVLGADAKVTVGSYDELLATELPAGTILGSLSRQVADPVAKAALANLATAAKGAIRLSSLISLGELGRQNDGGAGLISIDTLDIASNVIQGSATSRQVALDLGAQIPGLAKTRLWVAIGDRPANSPWIALTRDRTPVIRTAQTRVYLESTLNAAPLPGISLASVELPIFIEVASGEARLEALSCGAPRSVDLGGRPGIGQVAIARVDPNSLNIFRTPVSQADARILQTLLVSIDGRSTIDLGAAETFQVRRFDAAAIAAGTPQTVRSSTPIGGVASSLMQKVELRARLLGGLVPLPLDPVVRAVGSQLSLIAPVLDPVLMSVTNILGVGVGEEDMWVTGLRCGTPVLVQ